MSLLDPPRFEQKNGIALRAGGIGLKDRLIRPAILLVRHMHISMHPFPQALFRNTVK